ncbi:MAG: DUF1540 domain-containing protein [Clostridia bacterium]|nr:DUF1540 domain-containing protein [Clostridia bacterium]
MELHNNSVNCDVCTCKHNVNGYGCCLNKIKITKDCTDCTCCDSFSAKDAE